MRLLIIFSLIVSFLMLFSNLSTAMACSQSTPKVVVKRLKKNIEYIRNYSAGNLTQIHTGRYVQGGPLVGGLGGGRYGLGVEIDFNVKEKGNGLSCLSIKKVEGQFIAFPLIMIASNFAKDSCEFNAVYDHEKKHVRTLMNFQKEYSVKFRSRLNKIVRKYGQAKVTSPAQVAMMQQQINQSIQSAVNGYFEAIQPVINRRQQAVDSPQEYARVAALCSGWGVANQPILQRKY